jgi:Ni,Fe-hydrogenase III large subunit
VSEHRTASGYRNAVGQALRDGFAFTSLYAAADGGPIRSVFRAAPDLMRIETLLVDDQQAASIIDLVSEAVWDEREAHDLYGVAFTGHTPLRPLVNHPASLAAWTVPVRGADAYQVAVGPVHAGVIESGHFRFHVVGDRILHLDPRLFYKHRGLERAARGVDLQAAAALVLRVCAGCAVTNSVAYAQACEQALGLRASEPLARTRTVLLELERVWNHLNDIAAVCSGVGLAAGNTLFATLSEQARALNLALTGHRYLFHTVRVGESRLHVSGDQAQAAQRSLTTLASDARRGWRELEFNASFQDRLDDVGVVGAADAAALGTVGPPARAAGIVRDAREHAGDTLAYAGFAPARNPLGTGDVRARLEQRAVELWQSFALLETLLERPLMAVSAEPDRPGRPVGVSVVESPRGATSCVVERDADRVARLRLRTASYANWASVAHAAAGSLLPDFPLINKSFELCYACVDR